MWRVGLFELIQIVSEDLAACYHFDEVLLIWVLFQKELPSCLCPILLTWFRNVEDVLTIDREGMDVLGQQV
jgi:hypothetical protein